MMDCTDVKNFKPGGVYLQADSETGVTYPPLKFNPMTGHSFDGVERLQKASDYRGITWFFNPWTGRRRSLDDVGNDPNGSRIQPPSEYMFSTDGAHFATGLNATATELSAEAERCTYCGRRGADNCDVPPPDVCEKAIAPEPASSEPTSPLGEQIGGNHYKDMKIQPVEFIHANGIGFFEGNGDLLPAVATQ